MSNYQKYMNDRSIEQSLTEEERKQRIESFYSAVAINRMEGEEISKEEEEFALYCQLNNIPFEVMIDRIFMEKGLEPINHEKAKLSKLEYEQYEQSLRE